MGRVALVTGGTRGIGEAISKGLKAAGYTVAANYAGNDEAASKFKDETGIAIYKWDVSDFEACAAGIAKVEADLGPVEVLVNNAGITKDKSMKKLTDDDWNDVLDTNLGSVYATCSEVLKIMMDQKYGRIIMTTSTSGLFGNFGQANYGAAKLGLVGFMNTLRFEGAKYNVFTNAIAPIAATRMTVELPGFEDSAEKLAPELVTPAVVYLCSEKAPNGRIIQFFRTERNSGKTSLWQVDLTGDNLRRLPTPVDASDPACAPPRPSLPPTTTRPDCAAPHRFHPAANPLTAHDDSAASPPDSLPDHACIPTC